MSNSSDLGIQGNQEPEWYLSVPFIAGAALLLINIILIIVYRKMVVILIKTFPRDVKIVAKFLKFIRLLKTTKLKNMTVPKSFDVTAAKFPNKVCFFFENEEWTYKQVQDYANRVANYFQNQGYRKGDTVALFMENRPQYVCIWLGLSKIGVVPALVNYNLRLKPLLHSFDVVQSKAIIFGHELSEALQELDESGSLSKMQKYCQGHRGEPLLPNAVDLDETIKHSLPTAPITHDKTGFYDNLFYIFTSGTTGLPKAAIIKHSRFYMMSIAAHVMYNITESDIQYTSLPLFHTSACNLAIGQSIIFGTSTVIRKKFSASKFWSDCRRYKVTTAQYIGEICRYLYSQPPSPEDTQHGVQKMYGNGLRKEIWKDFTTRFAIPQIYEFYGSTEGNCSLVNIDNKVGAVGFLPRLAYPLLPTCLVKVDEVTGEIIRTKEGRVTPCKPNEPGELIGKIIPGNALRDFHGYVNDKEKEKKILRGAFRDRDAWFKTGDLLVFDDLGYFYFKDRTGDTFRWKGENCSTMEIEAVISNICQLNDCVAYGVEIPNTEGRACMISIADPDNTVDLNTLAEGVTKSLPSYARPLFVRSVKQVDMTGTYKMKKGDLQKEAYDITKISDNVYFFNGGKYVPLDKELYSKIVSGQIRL